MDQRFLDETVSRKAALFEAMVEFNRSQLRASSSASALALCPNAAPALLNDAKIRRACMAASPDGAQAQPFSWWDFSDETRRLILLSREQLTRLALCFSAAIHAEELARILDREQVLRLRAVLGHDVFAYAIRRGRYQIGSLRQSFQAFAPSAPLAERILSLARTVLLLMGSDWPDELRAFWQAHVAQLDLGAGSPQNDATSALSALPVLSREQRRALWFTLKKILLREAAPQWVPFFD